MNNKNKNIETPFSFPLNNTEFIKEQAELWKVSNDRCEKIKISKKVISIYGKDSDEYKLFESLKMRTNINYKPKEINYVTIEGKERDSFNQVLIEYLDKYLMQRNDFSDIQKDVLWNFGSNNSGGKLPNYFWMRMSRDVLPRVEKEGCPNRHAWLLAIRLLKNHESEFISMLQKTSFKDWNHISNAIIKFINKYMIVEYSNLIKQAKHEILMKKRAKTDKEKTENLKALQDNNSQDFDPFEYKRKKERGNPNRTSNPTWDTSGLI